MTGMDSHQRILNVFAAIDAEHAALTDGRAAMQSEIVRLSNQNADLRAEVARLEALLAEHEQPEPPTITTRFGACPAGGGASLAAANTVLTKYGPGAAIRQFHTGFPTTCPRPAEASVVHHSFKPPIGQPLDEAAITKSLASLKPGDVVEVWHESDKKVRDGQFTLNQAVATKNAFYDLVKRIRPDLLVAHTTTGWLFEPGSKFNADEWGAVKADILGVDLDGINPATGDYPDFTAEIPRAQAFIEKFAANGYRHWAVPEFNAARQVSDTGSKRTAWHDTYADLFRREGALYVALYEYNSTPNMALNLAEAAAWKRHVAGGAR